jgi:CubicO group peptidase (beta-lactamase class C family)
MVVRFAMVLVCLGLISPTFSAEPDAAAVDQIFSVYGSGSPGCSLGVIRDGSFVYRHGYGLGSLELAVPLTSESVFYMGSVSKQFTATSILIAARRGLLSLDDDVRKYIPELPDYGHPITLRQMLHHTSGFRDVLELLALSGRNAVDIHSFPELLELVTRQKGLNFTPGDHFLYSNTNYFLLAEVVHRVSKEPLSQFAQENIFGPLRMTHTRFYDDRTAVMPGRVAAYALSSKGGFLVDWSTNFEKVGDGGLMSSVDDLLHWDQNFYDDKLADGSVVKELQVRGRLNSGKEIDYALGLQMSDYRGLPTVEHGGSLFGYTADLLRFPQQRFTVICLCNLETANAVLLARKVADIYLEGEFRKPAPSNEARDTTARDKLRSRKQASDPAQFAGTYESDVHNVVMFTTSDGQLALPGPTPRILESTSSFHFTMGDALIEFDANKSKGVTSVKISRGGDVEFTGVRVELAHPDDAQLSAYAGYYHSEELDTGLTLSIENGRLLMRQKWNAPLPLKALAKDEFQVAGPVMVFRRDSSNKITGFVMFGDRARGMQFERSQ